MLCPAKINRTLFIGEKQKNGLHSVDSEMQKIALFDELTITKSQTGGIVFMLKNPNGFEVPDDKENIVLQAAQSFFGKQESNISIVLQKNIPSGAGLGGGSSDAAKTLLGLGRLFPNTKRDIFFLGKKLGSDISFFLNPLSKAQVQGTGEIITPLENSPSEDIAIIKPKDISVSTAWAYKSWDQSGQKGRKNDFESIVLLKFPEIKDIANTLASSGAKEVHLCGSGASVYGIFSAPEKAESATKKFDQKKYWRWTGKTL